MIPGYNAIDHANKNVTISTNNPREVTVCGRTIVYSNAVDAQNARDDMSRKLAEILEEYALQMRILNSWDPVEIRSSGH